MVARGPRLGAEGRVDGVVKRRHAEQELEIALAVAGLGRGGVAFEAIAQRGGWVDEKPG